ncbi:hypothetical protein HED60_12310 [Planctomycetales bacterium ZRK34]|nr:hypothetical protein HED60_12310 [Planctomycetales bacterium ZRK34]
MKALSDRKRKQTLRQLLEADVDVASLEKTLGLRLEEVATWSLDEKTHAQVEGLLRWLDMQTQVMIGRYRIAAVARLYELATQQENMETARRAAAELLKTNLMDQRDDQVASLRLSRDGTVQRTLEFKAPPMVLGLLDELGREPEHADG